MSNKPGLGGREFAVGQQRGDPALFQVTDDTGVSVIATPSPIINADNPERVDRWTAAAPDHAQQRILTHRQRQPFCEACRRSTTKRQAEVMNDELHPRRAPRRRSQYPFGEALSEDLAPAQNGVATEAAGDDQKLYDPPRKRKISHQSPIVAMDPPGNRPARWTHSNASGRSDRNNGLITFVVRTLYNKPTRHQTGAVECLLHGVDFPQSKRQTSFKLHQRSREIGSRSGVKFARRLTLGG